MFIPRRIKIARDMKKLSRSDLAMAIGKSYDHVYQWETGKRIPKYENVALISQATGLDITFFYTEFDKFNGWENEDARPDVNYEMGL